MTIAFSNQILPPEHSWFCLYSQVLIFFIRLALILTTWQSQQFVQDQGQTTSLASKQEQFELEAINVKCGCFILLTKFDEAMKQGQDMCCAFQSFLLIPANVPCMHYVHRHISYLIYSNSYRGMCTYLCLFWSVLGTCTYHRVIYMNVPMYLLAQNIH